MEDSDEEYPPTFQPSDNAVYYLPHVHHTESLCRAISDYNWISCFAATEFRFDMPLQHVKQNCNETTLILRERSPRLECCVTLDFARLTIDPVQ
ncbi:MAG TPA: hypothetical protein DIT01_22315 [Lentisphaeria bacterium]|nr:hypothetical protein [Lentisphaeria bacterium]